MYGRVAGKACAKYMFGANIVPTDLKQLSGGGISGGGTQKSALSGGSYEDDGKAPAPAAATGGASSGLTLAEVYAKNVVVHIRTSQSFRVEL